MAPGTPAVAALAAVLCVAQSATATTPPHTRRYRDLTTHTPDRVRNSRHRLDWASKPELYRRYPNAETLLLPEPTRLETPALEVIARRDSPPPGVAPPLDRARLGTILFMTAGISGRRPTSGGDIRTTAAAGALYPNEVYVVTGALANLDAGVYHYDPKRHALSSLRQGDWRPQLALAAADERIRSAPATLVLTGILWRSAWKYRERAYRHLFWDGGMMLAHTLAAAQSSDVPVAVLGLFIDRHVDAVVGVDGVREYTLALTILGAGTTTGSPGPAAPGDTAPVPPLASEPSASAADSIDYPAARQYHVASRLTDGAAVERLRERPAPASRFDESTEHLHNLPPPSAGIDDATLDGVVRRRRSTRRFARASISAAELAAFLRPPSRGAPVDFLQAAGTLLETYVIVHAVDGVPSGAYYYRPRSHQLQTLRTGDLRQMAGFLSLGQALPRDASAVVYYLSNLAATGETFDERGYRLAELEAGIVAGRAYLAAYAVGRGATGLTFFDHEVTEFFSPHATDLEPLLVMAIGVPRKRSDP